METATVKNPQIEMPDEPVFEMGSLGTGLILKKRQTMNLSEEAATALLNLPEFSGDRPLNNAHVVFLTRQMEGGLFRWEQVSIITCRLNGKEYRMNGQHTSWARLEIAKKDLPNLNNCPVQHLTYEASTEQDMRQLYATIDRNKHRSNGQVVISYLAGHEKFVNFSKKIIKNLAEGLAFWLWESDNQRALHVADERAFLMQTNYYKLTCYVGEFINNSRAADSKHMARRPVISAMFATWNKAPQIAASFWEKVRDGVGISGKNDPTLRLRNLLMTSTIAAGGDRRSGDETTVSSEEMYRNCIQAWNAYRDQVELKHFKTTLDKPRSAVR